MAPRRIIAFPTEDNLNPSHVIPVDSTAQSEASVIGLDDFVAYLAIQLESIWGGGGGGGAIEIENIGSGVPVYKGMDVSTAQFRSILSTTSALAITMGATEVTLSIALATTGAAGLMSSTDKLKLDGLPSTIPPVQLQSAGTGANVYAGEISGIHRFRSFVGGSAPITFTQGLEEISLNISNATTSAAGLMSGTDKAKLDALDGGGGGEPVDPVPNYFNLTMPDDTASVVDFASRHPDAVWFMLCDANDPNNSAMAVADFVHGTVALYSNPGAGIDLVASYGMYRTTTGVLTGTIGADNCFNLAAGVDFKLYLENRAGSTKIMRYFYTGGSGGEGGASTLGQLTDVDIPSPVDKQVLTYNQAMGKWVGQIPTGGGGGGGGSIFTEIIVGDASGADQLHVTYDAAADKAVLKAGTTVGKGELAITAAGDLLLDGLSLKVATDLPAAVAAAEAARDAAIAAQNAATTQADLARKWAVNPVNAPVSGGQFSSFHWAQQSMNTASIGRVLGVKVITDTDLVAGKYTLRSGDFFYLLAFRNTAACQLVCPPNLWLSQFGEAWVMIRRENAQVSVINDTAATSSPVLMANRSMVKRFPAPLTVAADVTEILTIPALSNAKIAVMVSTVYGITGSRTVGFATTGPTLPAPSNVYNDPYSGGSEGLKLNFWEISPTSFGGGDVGFKLTLPIGCTAMSAAVIVANNAGTREDTIPVKSPGVAGSVVGTLTTDGSMRMCIADMSQRAHDSLPVTVGGGLFRLNQDTTIGTPDGNDLDRFTNLGHAYGYEIVAATADRTYSGVFNAANGPTAMLLCAYPPFSATPLSSVVRSAGSIATISTVDGVGVLHASPDGITYWFNVG